MFMAELKSKADFIKTHLKSIMSYNNNKQIIYAWA